MSSYFRKARRYIQKHNKTFPANSFRWIPKDDWPQGGIDARFKVGRSRDYVVQLFHEDDNIIRLTVNRTDILPDGNWVDGMTWDELQRIKAMAGYADHFAVEIYPEADQLVNDANMRHLWIFPAPLSFGWRIER